MNILVLGRSDAPYHPLTGPAAELQKLLGDRACITVREDTSALLDVANYDLFLNYVEFGGKYTAEEAAALITYIANGGKMLAIHNGISMQQRPELTQLLGGRFAGHPAYKTLPLIPFVPAADHPLTQGVEPFFLHDEEYTFALEEDGKDIFIDMEAYGKRIPAAWSKSFCKGQIIYFAFGHSDACFANPVMGRLILNAVDALCPGK
ncbi:MAG: ThuA domain-containing protein [Eubacteriales bacterium]|nr:ThuA domain-containing protein [Eubacteriales bacterium]